MKEFQIADVAGLCELNAHTIRMWENRYSLLSPARCKGNYRTYSLKDVDYLLKVALLNKTRFRISRLAVMDAAAIDQHLKYLNTPEEQYCRSVDRLIVSMFAMNTEEFEAVLDSGIIHWGIDKTIEKIILPFIERTKLFSCKNCESEMDFAITALRKKIILGIETTNPRSYSTKTLLLFLPGQEHFDLLILYCCYLAKLHGFGVLYMGTNVSIHKVRHVAMLKQPHHLITYSSELKKPKDESIFTLPFNITVLSAERIAQNNNGTLHFSQLPALLAGM